MWTLYREDVSRECDCEEEDCPFHWLHWQMPEHDRAPLLFRTRSDAEHFRQEIVPGNQRHEWVARELGQKEIHLLARLWGNGTYYLRVEPTRYALVGCPN